MPPRSLANLCLASLILGAPALAETYAQRSVADALRQLERNGISFIYSSELIPPTAQVTVEPHGQTPVAIAEEIVHQLGLKLRPLRAGLYLIERDPHPQQHTASAPTPQAPRENDAPAIDSLVVSASRYLFGESLGEITMQADRIAAEPHVAGDLLRSVQRVPGTANLSISARAYIRGGEDSETEILFDGYPLRHAYHTPGYHSIASVIDPLLISQLQIYTGGYPVRYGERMSGVIDIRGPDIDHDNTRVLGASTYGVNAKYLARSNDGSTSWLGTARYGSLSPLLDEVEQADFRPTYLDAFNRFVFNAQGGMPIELNILTSRDDVDPHVRRRGVVGHIDSESHYIWMRTGHEWRDDLSGEFSFGLAYASLHRAGNLDDGAGNLSYVDDRQHSQTSDLHGTLRWAPGMDQRVEVGTGITWGDARYRYHNEISLDPLIATLFGKPTQSARMLRHAAQRARAYTYADDRWQFAPRWAIETGFRVSTDMKSDGSEETLWDPRVALAFESSDRTQWRLSVGHYSQVTDADELRVADGEVRFPHAQSAEHFVLSFQHDLSPSTRLRIEGFEKHYEHPRVRYENQLDNLSLFPDIAADRVAVAPTRAQARGLEMSLRTEGAHWNAWLAYAYTRAEDDIANRWVPRSWDQPQSVRAGYEWWISHWSLAWTANWHSGWPQTPLHVPNDVVALGSRNGERLRDYIDFDARLERRFALEHSAVRTWIEIANVLNENNNCCRALTVSPGTPRVVAENRPGAPLIAALAVSWEF